MKKDLRKELLAILSGVEKMADHALMPVKDGLDTLLKAAYLQRHTLAKIQTKDSHSPYKRK